MKYCRSCRAFVPSGKELDRDDPEILNQKVQLGECRRYAPQPTTVSDGSSSSGIGVWPGVPSDAGCGEWDPAFE